MLQKQKRKKQKLLKQKRKKQKLQKQKKKADAPKKAEAPKAEEKKQMLQKQKQKLLKAKNKNMFARIFTLYPEFFPGPLGKGLYGKALDEKIWNLETVNIRDYAKINIKLLMILLMVEDSGMLIKPDVLANSLDKNLKKRKK